VVGIFLGNMARFMTPEVITMAITGIFALLVVYNLVAKKTEIVEEQ
jgi:PTS system ascorbate-specific IIC component